MSSHSFSSIADAVRALGTDHDALRETLERLGRDAPEAPVEPVEGFASIIDHTVLAADADRAAIDRCCEEAAEHGFASVCINPVYVPRAADHLADSEVRVCTVIGFPLGATQSAVKAYETERAIETGAEEVDMVLAVGLLKNREWDRVEADIRAVVDAARSTGETPALVKVILETCLLSEAEIAIACTLALRAGADFVKTSTGFSTGGARTEDIALMHQMVGGEMGIKASGGVRSAEDARAMVDHGATRIGASGSVAIVTDGTASSSY